MNPRPFLRTLSALAAAGALAACSSPELSGPPTIRTGRDQCSECGMIINEERCSCALLVLKDGAREYLLFDDIGCLLNTRETAEGLVVLGAFVRDHHGGGWLDFDKAAFLFADREKLPTPMGSGIVAHSSPAAAEAERAAVGGEIHEAGGIQAAHVAWLEAHFGKR